MNFCHRISVCFLFLLSAISLQSAGEDVSSLSPLLFRNPQDGAEAGVYWYFMDGNMSKEGITKDLESMKRSGLDYAIFLEVNVGIPQGPVAYMSDEWLDMFRYLVNESKRIGINLILGIGPGWAGSGGPWVKGAESMQHLVASSTVVEGSKGKQTIRLSVPPPRKPYFGVGNFSPEMKKSWEEFYSDVAVLAFPTPQKRDTIDFADEKALYYRSPYSSVKGVKQYLPTFYSYMPKADANAVIDKHRIINLTSLLRPDGSLEWNVPAGSWTVMRFGSRNNGAVTRPAPLPGIGMECDKLDTLAIRDHLKDFTERLFNAVGKDSINNAVGGIKMLHIDSWEMGAQNWTRHFREEFIKRRGYDPLPYYPAYLGLIVESREKSERFLWDLRLTAQELVIENHAEYVKRYSHNHGLTLSIEPYDMNPTADMELGVAADYPMCEFWSEDYGLNTVFSSFEATSAAHLIGQPVVPAESFTSHLDCWKLYPDVMKNQTDWAFASGINRLMFHTFQHQCLADSLQPGMTMGVYGVHWDRNETWWPMVNGYHKYVARCQYMLQQGRTVADILYLVPEGAPHVFKAPKSALAGDSLKPDRKGYSFDCCPPSFIYKALVKNGKIMFPSGASYSVLVLPDSKTITPTLLRKIYELIKAGATVVGNPFVKSPSLIGYPDCDRQVETLSKKIWGANSIGKENNIGKGRAVRCGNVTDNLYQSYNETEKLLSAMKLAPDFSSDGNCIRYTHRTKQDAEIYFLSNRTDRKFTAICSFRVQNMTPELWNPMNGETRLLRNYSVTDNGIKIPLEFDVHEAYFIIFRSRKESNISLQSSNFATYVALDTLKGEWNVRFNQKMGGPSVATFETLIDWSKSSDEGIKYYSGIASYNTSFDFIPKENGGSYFLDLGNVKVMARVWLNDKDLGTVWTTPFRVDVTSALKSGKNDLRVEVANLWVNRLIGDEQLPYDGVAKRQWPDWIKNNTARPTNRKAFATFSKYKKTDALLESGLLGPVVIYKKVE